MIRSIQTGEAVRSTLELGAEPLGIAELVGVVRQRDHVALSPLACSRVDEGHEELRRLVGQGARIYGLTTGVGALDDTAIDVEQSQRAQAAFLRSHAAGIGDELATDIVRAGMLVRAHQLSLGHSGIQRSSLQAYLAVLNADYAPCVPDTGSLGAADLCSLAAVALLLIGQGEATHEDHRRVSGAELLQHLNLSPTLAWRDGFALVASPAMSTGLGALLVHDALSLIGMSESACALHAVAQQSMQSSWDQAVVDMVPHKGALASALHMRELLASSLAANTGVRETLSTRSAHRVHGACRDAVTTCADVIDVELNAAIDNPVLLGSDQYSNNAANFHAQELAACLDGLGNALIAMAVASERRIAAAQLQRSSDENGFLSDGQGEHAGSMIAHYSAAAVVAELRMHAVPAAIQSIPVCNGSEDIAPMCWHAARRTERILGLCQKVTAIELWTARRAISMRGLVCPMELAELYQALGGTQLDDTQPVSEQLKVVLKLLRDPQAWTGWGQARGETSAPPSTSKRR